MRGWIGAAAAGMAVYAGASLGGLEGLALAAKPVPAALLALGVARAGDRPGARWLAAAMAFDALADGVIEVSFLGGLAVFLVGHLLRITAFTVDAPVWRLGRGLPFLLIGGTACAVVVPDAGSLGLPIVVYTGAIAAMAWRAAARVDGSSSAALGLAGATLFLVSDTLIAVDQFLSPLPWATWWVMSTYWGSQVLIAVSALGPPTLRSVHSAPTGRPETHRPGRPSR